MKMKDECLDWGQGLWGQALLQSTLPLMIAWLEFSNPLRCGLSWGFLSRVLTPDLFDHIHNSSPEMKNFHKNDPRLAFLFN